MVLYQVQRSHSDTDIRHSLSLRYDCYIPAPVSFAAPAKAILGNWETGGILTVQTGTPFPVLVSGVRSGRAIRILISTPDCETAVDPGDVNEYVNFSVSFDQTRRTVLGDAICNSLVGTGPMDLEFLLFKNVRQRGFQKMSRLSSVWSFSMYSTI